MDFKEKHDVNSASEITPEIKPDIVESTVAATVTIPCLSDTLPAHPLGPIDSPLKSPFTLSNNISSDASVVSSEEQKVHKTPNLTGVKTMFTTPKLELPMELDGVSDLFKTPLNYSKTEENIDLKAKDQITPRYDGMKKMLQTPKNDGPEVSFAGLSKLVQTPSIPPPTPSLTGIKTLLKTPTTVSSPKLSGMKNLLKTPKSTSVSTNLEGLSNLMETPKPIENVVEDVSSKNVMVAETIIDEILNGMSFPFLSISLVYFYSILFFWLLYSCLDFNASL